MTLKTRSRLVVFILSILVWLALTRPRDIQEWIAGIGVALLVTLAAGHFLVTTEKREHPVRRYWAALRYLIRFLWEMVKANLHVAYLVIHPRVPIHPGIVRIRTGLSKEAAVTVLSNSITLTPGTLTIDVDADSKAVYVHWIDVLARDEEEATRLIGGKFESLLTEVFE